MEFGDYRVEIIPDTEFRLDGGAMFGVVPRVMWANVCPPDEQNRITMNFEYWRHTAAGEELVARGEQQVACMQREGEQVVPVPVPAQLREALREYARS